jgi:hypothetical protein
MGSGAAPVLQRQHQGEGCHIDTDEGADQRTIVDESLRQVVVALHQRVQTEGLQGLSPGTEGVQDDEAVVDVGGQEHAGAGCATYTVSLANSEEVGVVVGQGHRLEASRGPLCTATLGVYRHPTDMKRAIKEASALAVMALGILVMWGSPAMAERVEEPAYTLVKEASGVELRRYGPTVRAVTVVENVSWDQATSEGFRRLAGYIFGGNTKKQSIAMTAPVTAQPQPSSSMKIAMTAPVTAQPASTGVRVTFTMPAAFTLANLPTPNDRAVVLEEVGARLVAVRRFSGFAGDAAFEQERQTLMNGLASLGVHSVGEAELARYDPPWTVPFFRRNEVAVEVEATVVH